MGLSKKAASFYYPRFTVYFVIYFNSKIWVNLLSPITENNFIYTHEISASHQFKSTLIES